MTRRITVAGLATALTDIALAVIYLLFALAHVRSFVFAPRPSLVFIVVLETLFAIFFMVRRQAAEATLSFSAWVPAIAGTFLPLLLRPVATAQDLVAAQLIQTVGMAFGVYGILSLNRSVGVVPANRGVRVDGAYRWVRHPLYAAYTFTNLGYLASNPSQWNATVFVLALTAQLIRIHHEEKLLLRDPAYASYAEQTRWRLLPFVF